RSVWYSDWVRLRVWQIDYPNPLGGFPSSFFKAWMLTVQNDPGALSISVFQVGGSGGIERVHVYTSIPADQRRAGVARIFAGVGDANMRITKLAPGMRLVRVSGTSRVIVKHWLIMLIATPLSLLKLRSWRLRCRGRGHLSGTCTACGYDLRATPE